MTTRAQPVSAASGQRYGQRKAQEDAQRAAPMAGSQPTPSSPGGGVQGAPVQRPNIFGPTDRPSEPLTAGAALGAGPSQLGMLPDDPFEVIRAVVLQGYDRTGALRRLLARATK